MLDQSFFVSRGPTREIMLTNGGKWKIFYFNHYSRSTTADQNRKKVLPRNNPKMSYLSRKESSIDGEAWNHLKKRRQTKNQNLLFQSWFDRPWNAITNKNRKNVLPIYPEHPLKPSNVSPSQEEKNTREMSKREILTNGGKRKIFYFKPRKELPAFRIITINGKKV